MLPQHDLSDKARPTAPYMPIEKYKLVHSTSHTVEVQEKYT
jgi:hypothetical protein